MKAIVLHTYGGLEALMLNEIPRPQPGPGQVLIRVEAVSVNYADIVRRRNDPYPLPTPYQLFWVARLPVPSNRWAKE